jgi:hypothetical protein
LSFTFDRSNSSFSVVSAPPFAEEHAAGDLLKKDTFEPVLTTRRSNSLSNDERLKE